MARVEASPDRIYSFLLSACEGKEPADKVEEFLRARSGRFRRLYFYEEKICTHCRGGFPPSQKFRNGFKIADMETGWCCSSNGRWFCGSGTHASAHEMTCPHG